MTFYYLVEIALAGFAFAAWASGGHLRVILAFRTALWFVVIFRFQTGYDWMYYVQLHNYLHELPPDCPVAFRRFVEPGYAAFAWLVARMTSNPQVLFWISSVAVLSVFLALERLIERRWTGVFYLIVVNFLLFTVLFSVVRQSLALALCLLGLLLWARGRWLLAAAALALSPFFHLFGAAYLAISAVALIRPPLPKAIHLGSLIGMAALARAGWEILKVVELPGFLLQISIYAQRPGDPLDIESLYVLALALLVIVFFSYDYLMRAGPAATDVFLRTAVLTAAVMIATLDVAILRNRLLYLLVPCLAVTLLSAEIAVRWQRLGALAFCLASGVYFGAWLMRDSAFVLVPYRNFWIELAGNAGVDYKDDTNQDLERIRTLRGERHAGVENPWVDENALAPAGCAQPRSS